jgi:hypothetical protein
MARKVTSQKNPFSVCLTLRSRCAVMAKGEEAMEPYERAAASESPWDWPRGGTKHALHTGYRTSTLWRTSTGRGDEC